MIVRRGFQENPRPFGQVPVYMVVLAQLILMATGVADGAAQVPRLRSHIDDPVCRRPAPSSACAAFWISEVSYSARFTDSVTYERGRFSYVLIEGGAMGNYRQMAFGAGVYYALHVDGRRWGIKPRVRHWFGNDAAIDFMPGFVLGGRERRAQVTYPGWTMQVGLELGGLVGVTSGVEVVGRRGGGTLVDWHAGGRVGGEIGAYAGLVTVALILILGSFPSGLLGPSDVRARLDTN